MAEKFLKNKCIILLFITASVYLFLKYLTPLLTPLLLAVLLVVVSVPFFDKIRKKVRLPRILLMSLFLLIVIAILGVLIWFFVAKIAECLPGIMGRMELIQNQLCHLIRDCCDGMESRFGVNAREMETVILERVNIFIEHFQVNVLSGLVNESLSYAKYVVSIGAFLAVTAIAVILLVKDYDKIMESLQNNRESLWFLEILEKVIHYIVTFLKAQLIIMLSISVLCSFVLWIAGIDNGVILGMLAGFLDMLPFIGTGIVLIPLGIWQLLNGWYVQAVVCLLVYAACAILRELLEPKLIGEKVGIYPIAILLSVYAGVKLFGVAGIIKGPLGLVIICQIYNGWKERMRQAEYVQTESYKQTNNSKK